MSKVSRSNQFGAAPRSDDACRSRRRRLSSSPTRALRRTRWRLLERVEVQHDLEARRRALGVVDAAEVDEHVDVAARIVAEEARDLAASAPASTTAVSSPNCECVSRTASPNFALSMLEDALCSSLPRRVGFLRRAATSVADRLVDAASRSRGLTIAGRAIAARDLVLQQHQAVEHRLGARRAAGDVDVARDDFVDARRRVV